MSETLNIYQKIASARKKLKDKNLTKTGENPQFKGRKYFELSDFLPHTVEIFAEVGLIGIFNIDHEQATLTIINTENPIENVIFVTPSAEARGQSPIQAVGSQHTYLKRYLYFNAMEIAEFDTVDAPGAENGDLQSAGVLSKTKEIIKQNEPKQQKEYISKEQIDEILELYGDRIEGMLQFYKVSTLKEITASEAQKLIEKERSKHQDNQVTMDAL